MMSEIRCDGEEILLLFISLAVKRTLKRIAPSILNSKVTSESLVELLEKIKLAIDIAGKRLIAFEKVKVLVLEQTLA